MWFEFDPGKHAFEAAHAIAQVGDFLADPGQIQRGVPDPFVEQENLSQGCDGFPVEAH
ncbi:MAG: hypothetical protein ACREE5_04965 [Acetobacteraceae bacterium]